MSSSVLKTSASGVLMNRAGGTGHSSGNLHDRHKHGHKEDSGADDPIMAVLNRQWKKKIDVKGDDVDHGDGKPKRAARRTVIGLSDGKHDEGPSSPGMIKNKASVHGTLKTDTTGASAAMGNMGARSRFGGGGKDMTVDVHNHNPSKHDMSDATPGIVSPASALFGGGAHAPGAGRRFTVSLDQMVADHSPRWKVLAVRRAACKLEFKDTTVHVEEEDPTADKVEANFINLASKLQTWVGQCNMQMTKLLADIRKRHAEDASILDNPPNLEKLKETILLVATVNYHMTKWLHQLDPKKEKKPTRPQGADTDGSILDFFAELQFGLSKMDKIASTLGPALFSIVTQTKRMRRSIDGQPLSPNQKRPSVQAQKRGIQDIAALDGLVGHLEYLLDVTQSLAYRPVATKGLGAAVKVLIAASRFKKGLFKKKAAAA